MPICLICSKEEKLVKSLPSPCYIKIEASAFLVEAEEYLQHFENNGYILNIEDGQYISHYEGLGKNELKVSKIFYGAFKDFQTTG